jgi:hypothetical protein
MTRLRIVNPENTNEDITMREAIEALFKRITAENPSVMVVSWEAGEKMTTVSIPDSVIVQKGFAAVLYEQLFETPSVTEVE